MWPRSAAVLRYLGGSIVLLVLLLLALSAWRANDAAATRQWLDLIANDGETPPSLRSRAEVLQALMPPVAKS